MTISSKKKKVWDVVEPRLSYFVLTLIFQLTRGLTSERLYWSFVLWRRRNYREARRLDPEVRKELFPEELLGLVPKINSVPVRVIELGSGPLSDLAWGVESGLVNVTAVDLLAETYTKLLDRFSIRYPIRPQFGVGEDLVFPDATFDVAYARNSIDHTTSPRLCLQNLVRVLVPGGFLIVSGNVREGTKVGWSGLHQHDLLLEDNELIHYDRQGTRTNLIQQLPMEVVSRSQTHSAPGGWFNIIFRKADGEKFLGV